MNRRTLLGAGVAAIATPLASPALISPARAQGNWPNQPIRFVVPFAAGGPTDIPARLFAERMGAVLPQRIIVENRTGAGVLVGTEVVAKANDGHTFLYTTVAHAVLRALFQRLPFDPDADFMPVALVGVIPMLITVGKDSRITDLRGLQAALKADPGGMTYASSGNGGALHLATELMLRAMQARALHVPYRGTAAAMPDVLNGTIPLIVDVATSAVPYAQRGETRALAVMDTARLPQLPDVPTTAEAGFPGLEAYTWHMVLAPKGTPAAVVQTMNRALMQVAAEAAVQQRLSDLAMRLVTDSTPDSAAAWLRDETQKWSAVVREANITIN
ncbi:Bug family tripartite tricarboxylate transporter substrate binding protein [Falsiroseomonas tokyonensis]|uniref:Bug family tripartite tricarboxylate transporter substrate binding protein n=1 Tax=Falsiroseomonas tokyonensis TaxID=430521 RepID=A0ABV7BSU8_9PROT|nr:tripartite tricarboxylate transporter substrate-binding protein [Falsiroseomonas tokyonensis]MBU8537576.1 tripartite tricarboxylate transporter substrate binding protein [Falsiroseomonas tokyonensis]